MKSDENHYINDSLQIWKKKTNYFRNLYKNTSCYYFHIEDNLGIFKTGESEQAVSGHPHHALLPRNYIMGMENFNQFLLEKLPDFKAAGALGI